MVKKKGAPERRRVRSAGPKIEYLDRLSPEREAEFEDFCSRMDLSIRDLGLLNRALSHKSYTNELGYEHNEQNEKLEFLGDSVLGLVCNDYLFKRFPEYKEGDLAKIKSAVVSEAVLYKIALSLELGQHVLLGRGEEVTGGRNRPALLADVIEAVIGAIYLDGGLPAARKFILRYLESEIMKATKAEGTNDFKSLLQELVQKRHKTRPVYQVLKAEGPDHEKKFRVAVLLKNRRCGIGEGNSKKDAEQAAAEQFYRKLMEKDKKEEAVKSSPDEKSDKPEKKTKPSSKTKGEDKRKTRPRGGRRRPAKKSGAREDEAKS